MGCCTPWLAATLNYPLGSGNIILHWGYINPCLPGDWWTTYDSIHIKRWTDGDMVKYIFEALLVGTNMTYHECPGCTRGWNVACHLGWLQQRLWNAVCSHLGLLLMVASVFERLSTSNILLQVVKQLKLLPLTAEEVEHRVNSFRHFTDEVRMYFNTILCILKVMIFFVNQIQR